MPIKPISQNANMPKCPQKPKDQLLKTKDRLRLRSATYFNYESSITNYGSEPHNADIPKRQNAKMPTCPQKPKDQLLKTKDQLLRFLYLSDQSHITFSVKIAVRLLVLDVVDIAIRRCRIAVNPSIPSIIRIGSRKYLLSPSVEDMELKACYT